MKIRAKVFFLHLSASTLLASFAVAIVYIVWYPSPLAVATGVSSVVAVLLAVDVILGPLLTLLLFKSDKKSRFLDLAVVVFVQMAAFVYGMTAIAEARPAWVIFNVDRFDLVLAKDLDRRRIEFVAPEFQVRSWLGPLWAASVIPADPAQRAKLLFEAVAGGADLPQRADLYVPLREQSAVIKTKAQSWELLREFNDPDRIEHVKKKWPDSTSWLPLMASAPMVVLIDKGGRPVAIEDLRPWL